LIKGIINQYAHKKKVWIAVCVLLIATTVILGLVIPTKIHSNQAPAQVIPIPQESLSDTADKETIIMAIREVAKKYLIDEIQLLQTIKCESGFQHAGVFGDGGLAYGLAQFHRPTFDGFCKGSYYSAEDQLECMAQMFANKKQFHWTCWRKYFTN
jgi:hypothetical protein